MNPTQSESPTEPTNEPISEVPSQAPQPDVIPAQEPVPSPVAVAPQPFVPFSEQSADPVTTISAPENTNPYRTQPQGEVTSPVTGQAPTQPQPIVAQPSVGQTSATGAPQKSYIAVWLLAFLLPGIEQFYLGYIGRGILKLVTLQGVGIWYIVTLVRLFLGKIKSGKKGGAVVGREQYLKVSLIITIAYYVLSYGLMGILFATGFYQSIFKAEYNAARSSGYSTTLTSPVTSGTASTSSMDAQEKLAIEKTDFGFDASSIQSAAKYITTDANGEDNDLLSDDCSGLSDSVKTATGETTSSDSLSAEFTSLTAAAKQLAADCTTTVANPTASALSSLTSEANAVVAQATKVGSDTSS